MNYGFSVRKLVGLLLPSFLRQSKQVAWIETLLAPFDRLRGEFAVFIDQTRYNVTITGQVIILESHLNNVFDFALRRIQILDGNLIGTFVWFASEGQAPDYTRFKNETDEYSPFLRSKSEAVQAVDFDFTVIVPSEYEGSDIIIKSVIEAYKLAGKRYQIIYT